MWLFVKYYGIKLIHRNRACKRHSILLLTEHIFNLYIGLGQGHKLILRVMPVKDMNILKVETGVTFRVEPVM